MTSEPYAVVVEATQGSLVESRHRGLVAVANARGVLLASVGDVNAYAYMRSSAKPLQAIPLVESGAAEHYGFTHAQLAVVAASHSGEPFHLEAVRSILDKIGLSEEALLCGAHWPASRESSEELRRQGEKPRPIHNNCSGKHAGMLALAVHGGQSIHDYKSPDHPVQVRIRRTVAEFAGLADQDIILGIDGCGVPTLALPVWRAAHAYARLVDPSDWGLERRQACARIVAAMQAEPHMVAGPGRISTDLMRVGGSRLVAKGGAEGYFAVGILPGNGRPGIGLTIKIEDGDLGGRAGTPLVLRVLEQIRVLREKDLTRLGRSGSRDILNHWGDVVGELRAITELNPTGPDWTE